MDKLLIINRAKEALGVQTDQQFAEKLGLVVGTISSWKSRRSIDLELIIEKCNGVDLNWLIYGRGVQQNAILGANDPGCVYAEKNDERVEIYKEQVALLKEQINLLREEVAFKNDMIKTLSAKL